MSKEKRIQFLNSFIPRGFKYLEYVTKLDVYELRREMDDLPTEAFKNAMQNRLEVCQKEVDNWFKELIQKVGDYAE